LPDSVNQGIPVGNIIGRGDESVEEGWASSLLLGAKSAQEAPERPSLCKTAKDSHPEGLNPHPEIRRVRHPGRRKTQDPRETAAHGAPEANPRETQDPPFAEGAKGRPPEGLNPHPEIRRVRHPGRRTNPRPNRDTGAWGTRGDSSY